MTQAKSTKGLTPVQMIGIVVIILIAIGLVIYLTVDLAEKPGIDELTGNVTPIAPAERHPAVADLIAEYDKEYDENEYCFDDVYQMRCEKRCGSGGTPVEPTVAFADCAPPKRCCEYEPEEWTAFEEPEDDYEGLESRCAEEYEGQICTTDEICKGKSVQLDELTCCEGICVEDE